jgi:hypothetical protein
MGQASSNAMHNTSQQTAKSTYTLLPDHIAQELNKNS